MSSNKDKIVLEIIEKHESVSIQTIINELDSELSLATVKRILRKLIEQELIAVDGKGKSTKYKLSSAFKILNTIDVETYYLKDIDDRKISESFNFQIIEQLSAIQLFSKPELEILEKQQEKFRQNVSQLSEVEYNKEMERLAIDLSWKSSQIEGNTYSLLETERLLKEKLTADGKTKDEATMLLNHKECIDFILDNRDYLFPLKVSNLENIHRLLIKELGIGANIRKRRVGISGTNYRPLDNEFQIREALEQLCHFINSKQSVFEQAFIALVLISYIQPFEDGNKRTARILSNALLLNANYCPISFRTVDSIDYKKAMLLFYEQNNISAFKKIFIDQFEFATETYF
jgi:fido (protein-threonine AMPylation protein)/predicted transcriptional regulator